jgi:hypothetical protein
MEPLDHTVCRLIERAAGANRLPVEFLTRLIWRESSFRPGAISPAGARGNRAIHAGHGAGARARRSVRSGTGDPEGGASSGRVCGAASANLGVAAAAY